MSRPPRDSPTLGLLKGAHKIQLDQLINTAKYLAGRAAKQLSFDNNDTATRALISLRDILNDANLPPTPTALERNEAITNDKTEP